MTSQRSKHIAGCILLAVFAVYYANIAFFGHSHLISGVTVVHSHFHNGAHPQTGTHTGSELTLISELSQFDTPQVSCYFAVADVFPLLVATIRTASDDRLISAQVTCPSSRAPPFHSA